MDLAAVVVPECVTFTQEDAASASLLFNATGRRRGSLLDCMIAATAIRFGAVLATSNPGDFARFRPHALSLASE